ncbi:AraC family transcriptional regulator [Frateuria aurantia]|uniref:DNA-binding domain-containing protein, AraC-type n=1 Tax=Frateuria aurantia (strain ATCC 33424 / DSM 6220 / KCTC 2777 / LMG 1558 / NBRC 3245 / NCIMB 13370) TaxID=767434 RepID=H8L1S8_FRAAD|nr:helix-turn-helix transcriptional regulator [Frateuria aurantia]AFC86339.1 DNA-binding domain-containing protein, AraC-type [Frateuria aurantia DSM 6220]
MTTVTFRLSQHPSEDTVVYDHPMLVAEVDSIPRPVAAKLSTRISKHWERATHHHRKAQLLYSVRGLLRCQIADGIWIVPPQCAIWIPGDLPHSVRGSGETECYCLFVEPDALPGLPRQCCTLSVSPLLRELLTKAAGFDELYPRHGKEDRLVATLLDELAEAPVEHLHLPIPRDARLRRLSDLLLADPADKQAASAWASRVGMSERHMSRLLSQEIGMSFGQWRRQLHITLAVQHLTRGLSVQAVAMALGYENASGFVTMFRKAVGQSPGRYLSGRHAAAGRGENVPANVPISVPE